MLTVLYYNLGKSQHLRRSDARMLRYSISRFLSILAFVVAIVAWTATYSPL